MHNYPAPCEDPLDYVPFLNSGWRKPTHLQTMGVLAREIAAWARGDTNEPIRALVTYPIRHFKSETILAICVWLLEQFPWLQIMLLTYDIERAEWLGKRLRELCQVVRDRPYIGPAKGWNRLDHWKNTEGGGVTILSAQQSREGFTVHVLICDDPINEKQIAKPEDREACDRAITFYTGRTLLFRDGGYSQGPVIIVASRFSRDDMIGRRLDRPGWQQFYKPAINDNGEPFAPEIFTIEQLHSIRAELAVSDPREETWHSRWQGTPREDRGADKFKPNPARYEEVLLPGGTDAIGVHLISGESQWFAMCRIRISGGLVYVLSCDRFVADPNELAKRVTESFETDGRCDVYAYINNSERIALRRMQEKGVVVTPLTSGQNPAWQALRVIQLWEENKVLWPKNTTRFKSTIARFAKFRGTWYEEEEDEEISALVAVVEGSMLWASETKPEWAGKKRGLP